MMNTWKQTKLKIKDLRLWDENARFSDRYFNQPEKELSKYFLSKKNFKVFKLAEEIVKDFDLPQLEKLVVYRSGDANIVLEGNRRLTAYKLLANPNLIENNELKKKFSELGNQIKITANFELECIVTDNLEQGYRYIERKHLNNNNEVGWGDNERAHHKKRRGKAGEKEILKVEITKIIHGLDFPNILQEKVLGPGYVTTFWRLMEQSPAYKVFKFSFDKQKQLQIGDKDFGNKLKVIIWDVLENGKYNGKLFSRLNVKEIEDYLKSISEDDYSRVSNKIEEKEKQKVLNLFGEEIRPQGTTKQARRTPIVKQGNILFGRVLSLEPSQTNNLYRAIDKIYSQNQNDDSILPVIGMSLRLLLEVAGREYFANCGDDEKKKYASEDKVCEKFLKEARVAMDKQKENYTRLTLDWISSRETIIGLLHKYAHGNILFSRSDILQSSVVVADILETYFGKNEN